MRPSSKTGPVSRDKLRIRSLVLYNLRLIGLKILSGLMRVLPGRIKIIDLFSSGHAAVSSVARSHLKTGLTEFAAGTNVAGPPATFVKRYFRSQSRDRFFRDLFYEVPGLFQKYVKADYRTLSQAVGSCRGAILVGAHFGPQITGRILAARGFDVRGIFSTDWQTSINRVFRYSLPGLKKKRWQFVAEQLRPFVAGKNEKQALRHLKNGGVLLMLIDEPLERPMGTEVDILGRAVRFSHFPFKVSLNYDVPLFFFAVTKSSFGYSIVFKSASFNSIEEGLIEYAVFFEDRIRQHPHMWRNAYKLIGGSRPGRGSEFEPSLKVPG